MYPSPTWQPEDTGVATEFTPEEADHDVSKRESTASDPGGPPPSGAGPLCRQPLGSPNSLCGTDDSRLSHCPLVLLPHSEDSSRATHTPACLWNTGPSTGPESRLRCALDQARCLFKARVQHWACLSPASHPVLLPWTPPPTPPTGCGLGPSPPALPLSLPNLHSCCSHPLPAPSRLRLSLNVCLSPD